MFFVFLLFNEQIIHIRAECTAASSCCWFVQSLHYPTSVTDLRWQSQMGEQILKTVLDQQSTVLTCLVKSWPAVLAEWTKRETST